MKGRSKDRPFFLSGVHRHRIGAFVLSCRPFVEERFKPLFCQHIVTMRRR
jgi:hypothetical protein